jgi:PAS domain S-box-containing protein
MFTGIETSEQHHTTQDIQRLTFNLNITLSNLNNTVNDWAKWDDTYFFVQNNNTAYVDSNLADVTFGNLGLNAMLFFDQSENLVFGKLYNVTDRTPLALDATFVEEVTKYNTLFSSDSAGGLILVDGAPMLVAAHPILKSDTQGPSQGTLVIGRYLDSTEMAVLSSATGLPTDYKLINDTSADADFELALENLSINQPIYVHSLNETNVAGYVLLNDVSGTPILVMKLSNYRTEFILGSQGMTYITVTLLGIAIIVFIVVVILLDRIVTSRISKLSDTVLKIRKNGETQKRVDTKGDDEIASLSESINSMLNDIDQNTYTLEAIVAERTKDLVESRKQIESILQASPDAIVVMDLDGTLIECNARVAEISGFTRDAIVGKTAMDFIVGEFKQEYIEKHRPLVMQHRGVVRFETRFIKAGGDYPAEYSISTIWNEQNQPIGYVGVIRDLTEKKQMERNLLRSQRLAAIGELASMVGHDMRNPLAAIRNADYVMKKKCSECPNPVVTSMLDVIDKSIDHANNIITDLLEYSKEIRLNLSRSSPKSLLEKSLTFVVVPENIKLLDLTTDDAFKVDETKAIRVYINIIKNALDAMPEGGTLEVKSAKENDSITIAFTDTGQGILPETMPEIFSPLFTTKAQGMGFGLSISKRFVEAHGGKISFKSEARKGTTFTITFPIEPKPNSGVSGGHKDGLTSDPVELF